MILEMALFSFLQQNLEQIETRNILAKHKQTGGEEFHLELTSERIKSLAQRIIVKPKIRTASLDYQKRGVISSFE
jgi:hypothetical protein